jgi:hypothetical protein
MVYPSFEWAEVLGASNHCFGHITVFHGNNPGDALALLDESSAAVESSVRHATLLSTVKDDGDTVAFFVMVHDAADVQTTAFILSSSQDAASSYTLTL